MNKGKEISKGIKSATPITLGYIPVAIAFGLLARNGNISLLDSILFSAVLYAGAAQFMAIELILAGVSPIGIVVSVFLLNLRLLIMAMSLGVNTEKIKPRHLPILGFFMTDESFSVLSFNKEYITARFGISLEVTAYVAWVVGTYIGYILGEIIPPHIQTSLGIGLTAMFIALLVPAVKKDHKGLYLSLIGVVVYSVIYFSGVFHTGWDIILSILISSFLGVVFVIRRDDN